MNNPSVLQPADTFDFVADVVSVTQERYGEPSEVLKLSKTSSATLKVGPDDVVVTVKKRLIHPGDLHIIRGSSNAGPQSPIDPGKPRVPGFEGVGYVAALGATAQRTTALTVGQRVAFFAGGAKAWSTHAVVPAQACINVPPEVSDEVAAQVLINTVTAKLVLRAGHDSLPMDHALPVSILQTAAGSAVGRLISRIAMDLGVRPIRLVRTTSRARSLRETLAGAIISTDSPDWKVQVQRELGESPLLVAIDSVGGEFLNDVASLVQDGGTVVNFGWLGSGAPDLSSLAPRNLTLKGVSIGSWGALSAKERASDMQLAISLAQRAPELFEVAADFPLEKFQEAIQQAGRSETSAATLLSS